MEILAGKFSRKFLQENVAGNSCGEILWEILAGNAVSNLVGNVAEKLLMVCNRSKNGKKHQHRQFLALAGNFKPMTTSETLSNYFYLVEEVLSFDLVGHM